ncbi:MAG: hypothetical protein COC06_11900 [Bacteroidales bacterium]|nr:MAG: hypothetical protein COC06_11900 [Bacteroidales bacterium]
MIYLISFLLILVIIVAYIIGNNNDAKNSKQKISDNRIDYENVQISETKDSTKITFKNKAGYIDGKHYTEYVDDIKEFKRQNKLQDAENILLKIIEALKAEAKAEGPHWFLAPWYFEQLAIIYRKQKRIEKERYILEQYLNLNKIDEKGETPLEVRYRKVAKSG